MKPIKFYIATSKDHQSTLLGAVLDGVAVSSIYPMDEKIDAVYEAATLHKQVLKKYILTSSYIDDTNENVYHTVDVAVNAVGIAGMLAWNDIDDCDDVWEFHRAMVDAYTAG